MTSGCRRGEWLRCVAAARICAASRSLPDRGSRAGVGLWLLLVMGSGRALRLQRRCLLQPQDWGQRRDWQMTWLV